MCGFYLNELLLKLLPLDDPHETLFDRYVATLEALSEAVDPEPILRRFELGLLSELGYAQTLDQDASGRDVEASRRYGYAPGEGVVPDDAGGAYRGKTLLDMARGDFSDPRTLAEGKQLMRALINHYLGDKPLMTRQLLMDLQNL
jgi:DNA repair protein RecO (recombination protein O)